MGGDDLGAIYRRYIGCLNAQDWERLGTFVHAEVSHNGRAFGLTGYRAMLEEDLRQIPDLRFQIDLLVCEAANVAARLWFDCTPRGSFLGLPVNGRRVQFAEHVFYRFEDGQIKTVWSVLDKSAVEAALPS